MKRLIVGALLCAGMAHGLIAEEVAQAASAEDRVRELYDMISVEPGGQLPDWTKVRTFFVDEAVVFMRTSREASALFTLEQWVADFESFIETARVGERGFTEKIVRLRSMEFRDVAQVGVLYEGSFGDWTKPPQQGVDLIQLARVDGEWLIISIVNEIPDSSGEIPADLK